MALHSSGSTTRPRRVIRSTASWVDSFAAYTSLSRLESGSRVWVPGPRSSSMNLFAVVHASYVGATLVDDAAAATHATLTPAQLVGVLDLGHPLTAVVAGDALGPGLAGRARGRGLTVHHYYGAAELSFVAWGADADSLSAFPGVAVEVRQGEVWVRSPYLCSGYDGADGPLRRDADAWATVGDRGELADGRLRLHGRPGVVTTGGATVDVSEVEAVFRRTARGAVVVLGTPHPDLGQVVVAVLTDEADHGPLTALAASELVPAARPRRWFRCARLPLTVAGKVDRDQLSHDLGSGAARLRPLTRPSVVP